MKNLSSNTLSALAIINMLVWVITAKYYDGNLQYLTLVMGFGIAAAIGYFFRQACKREGKKLFPLAYIIPLLITITLFAIIFFSPIPQ